MITDLYIKGFKCFDEEYFKISPLTLLSGLNSSGKSSLLQAIRLFFGFKSETVGLGPLSELISTHHSEFKIKLVCEKGSSEFNYPKSQSPNFLNFNETLFSYISAARFGPENYLPLCFTEKERESAGERGEYVLDLLERNVELSGLPEILQHPDSKSQGVRINVSQWLGLISPGIQFDWKSIPRADLLIADYNGRRPGNVGFGVSYTLPIIANILVYAARIAKKKNESALILIENPEAHLHPAGQTKLGDFLARSAQAGVQIIVETHSDHLMNGIRLAVKNNILKSDETTFYFFEYNFDEEKTEVLNPIIDDDGFFDEWPNGFFDETEKNLERLL
ncbi:hypothetical protein DSCO28_70200 [Desulfosarcina ovata subsp. sediminis]|uniref:DUF3696 domain-containing protein n=1 Tax=Desulfosarcina ovata subsp. sediminis TaxID=885957 RepID=A0A5K8A2A7_9BACT|nr:DUF3696 domain-containing protein [Desulfosarcina ovata]BBO86454.1 hypothetical protein DSCO28_70200 [Desulfosarcina ovata subsp. sediminis]